MTTARDFITLALREAGISGVGQTPLAEDINDCFTLLHRMLAQWQKKRWMVPYLYEVVALGNNQKSNPIGPGQYYNSLRPDKIQAAYFKQLVPNDFGASFGPSFGPGSPGSNQVSFRLDPIWSYEDYALIQLKELGSWPLRFFYDGKYPYGNVYIWPIPSSIYEIHLIVKGAIGFQTMISTLEILNGGVGYVNGVYLNVPLTAVTGVGSGATADVTVSGSAITAIAINNTDNPGEFYNVGDLLTIPNTLLGGTGVGLSLSVSGVSDSLDSVFNMPEEYEDAIHYNLVKRILMHYQYPLPAEVVTEAKLSLNTIKIANAQIPTLQMPAELRNVRSNNFYIFNADAR
jgi:hypothetical protein